LSYTDDMAATLDFTPETKLRGHWSVGTIRHCEAPEGVTSWCSTVSPAVMNTETGEIHYLNGLVASTSPSVIKCVYPVTFPNTSHGPGAIFDLPRQVKSALLTKAAVLETEEGLRGFSQYATANPKLSMEDHFRYEYALVSKLARRALGVPAWDSKQSNMRKLADFLFPLEAALRTTEEGFFRAEFALLTEKAREVLGVPAEDSELFNEELAGFLFPWAWANLKSFERWESITPEQLIEGYSRTDVIKILTDLMPHKALGLTAKNIDTVLDNLTTVEQAALKEAGINPDQLLKKWPPEEAVRIVAPLLLPHRRSVLNHLNIKRIVSGLTQDERRELREENIIKFVSALQPREVDELQAALSYLSPRSESPILFPLTHRKHRRDHREKPTQEHVDQLYHSLFYLVKGALDEARRTGKKLQVIAGEIHGKREDALLEEILVDIFDRLGIRTGGLEYAKSGRHVYPGGAIRLELEETQLQAERQLAMGQRFSEFGGPADGGKRKNSDFMVQAEIERGWEETFPMDTDSFYLFEPNIRIDSAKYHQYVPGAINRPGVYNEMSYRIFARQKAIQDSLAGKECLGMCGIYHLEGIAAQENIPDDVFRVALWLDSGFLYCDESVPLRGLLNRAVKLAVASDGADTGKIKETQAQARELGCIRRDGEIPIVQVLVNGAIFAEAEACEMARAAGMRVGRELAPNQYERDVDSVVKVIRKAIYLPEERAKPSILEHVIGIMQQFQRTRGKKEEGQSSADQPSTTINSGDIAAYLNAQYLKKPIVPSYSKSTGKSPTR